MKKRRLAALLALIAAIVLTSCGGPGNSADRRGPLTILGRKSDMEKSYMTAIFERYEAATGRQLEVVVIEDADFEAEAAQMFAEGDGPDILMHFNNADLARFDVADNFLYLEDQPWVSELTDSARAYCQDADGHLLGLPYWESSVSGCYYNRTLLDSLGLKPATNQAEFNTLCQALEECGCIPICWPADGCTWMFQFGLDPIFADDPALLKQLNANEITYSDIPQVTDMVQWVADAADRGWFGPRFRSYKWEDIGPLLTSGEAAMTFIWDTWFYTDFDPSGKYAVDDFALMPVFMGTADGGTYEGGNLNMMMVNKNSDQLDEALEFLTFCATPENYNAAFEGISTVSCFQGQTTNIQSQMVTDAAESIAANERVSTAATRIVGYSADDVSLAFNRLFYGDVDVAECVQIMDECRIAAASKQGAEGFPPAAAEGAAEAP